MMMAALRATTTTTTAATTTGTMMLGRKTMRMATATAKKTPVGAVRAAAGGGNDPMRGMSSESASSSVPPGSRTPVMRKKRGMSEPLVFPPAYSYPLASGTASPMLASRLMDFEDTMRDFMDAFMQDPFGAGLIGGGPRLHGDKIPAKTELAKPMDVDAIVKGDKLIVTAALPGLSASDVKVEINDDNSLLFITATRTYRHEEDGGSDNGSVQYHAFESTHGTNQRTIGLPESADVDTIKTGMKNGMLKIEMKLKPEEKLEEEGPEEARRVINVEDR